MTLSAASNNTPTVRTPLYGVEVPVLAHHLADPEKGTGIAMICTFGDLTDVIWWRELDLDTRAAVVAHPDGLLVGFRVEEPYPRAALTECDSLVFQENDVELFLDFALAPAQMLIVLLPLERCADFCFKFLGPLLLFSANTAVFVSAHVDLWLVDEWHRYRSARVDGRPPARRDGSPRLSPQREAHGDLDFSPVNHM